ncbi:MFS transporter, partial [Streptomyces sp. NPDC060198]|uniref:MFS transporter n=1 Tax=Streptomyces sp. NPDC060198 TaxID=3347070 RepID=UPI0036579A8F
EEFGFSTLMITLVFATYAVGVVVALLSCGHVSDAIGRRRTLLPGLALSMASSVIFLAASELALLFPARLLSGLSAGLFTGTATAAIVDLAGSRSSERATLVATVTQMGGLGSGPLIGGLLAEYAPAPLRLPYALDLGLLVLAFAAVWVMPEPVAVTSRRPRPRIARPQVPRHMRGVFLRASIAGFAGFAVLGLFTAVVPSFLRELLDVSSPTVAGVVICAIFCASGVGQVVLVAAFGPRSLPVGCAGLILGMLLLTTGFATASFGLLLAGGLAAGAGQGMSFRAGLAGINAVAPTDRRGDLASVYFTVLYVALALPVVGVGLAADLFGLRTAGIAFGVGVALLAAWTLSAVLRAGSDA